VAIRNFIFTRHSEDMLIQREIDRQWIMATVLNPDALEADPAKLGVFRAFRSIAERGGRVLRVVYAQDGDNFRILTAFFDRKRSR
jgi:hypothetical protein